MAALRQARLLGTAGLVTALALCLAVRLRSQEATADVPVVEIGVPLELKIVPAGADKPGKQEFTLVAPAEGELTIDASSYDDRVVLARLGEDGTPLARSDSGGIGWNARLVVSAAAGERLRFGAAFTQPVTGTIRIEVTSGQRALPTGFELGEMTAKFWLECAKVAEARGDPLSAATRYHEAGQTFYGIQSYADCRRAYLAALPLAEQADHALLRTLAQGFLGAVAVRFGNPVEGRELLESAAEGAVAAQQPAFEMFCRSNLAEACQQLGDLAVARSSLERALAIARETKDLANEASLLGQRAAVAALEGDAASARELYAQSRRVAEGLGDSNRLAHTLNGLAQFHRARGELDEAEALLDEALLQAAFPVVRSATLGELGNVRNDQGRWTEARSLYQQVLDSARELGDEGLQAAALTNLGVVEVRAGDLVSANERLEQALALHEHRSDPGSRVHVLLQLSSLRYEQDRLAEAGAVLEQAQLVAEEATSVDLTIRVLHQRALLAAKDPQRLDEGGQLAVRQVELARGTAPRDDDAVALSMLAWVRYLQGRNDEAAETIAEAVEASHASAPHVVAAALSTQIDVALARSDLTTARAALAQGRELLAGLPLQEMDPEGASLARSSWSYAQFAELEQDVVALGLEKAGPDAGSKAGNVQARSALVAEGFRAAGRAQARALLEGIAEHRSGRRDAKAIALRRARQGLLADRQWVLEALARAQRGDGTDEGGSGALRERARQLETEADAVLADLRRHAPGEAALDVPPDVEPSQLQRDLLEGDILVQYAEGQEHLYAYVLTPRSLTWHDLGDRKAAGELAREHLDGISDPARLVGPDRVADTGSRAWRALLQPLLPADGSGTLIVVPTPLLAALPFESLVSDGSPDAKTFAELRFVIDRYDVRYVPSPAIMPLLAADVAHPDGNRVLVLADPLVPGEGLADRPVPRLANEAAPWARLPGTRTEALAIVDLLYAAVAESQEGERAPNLPPEERGGHLGTELFDVYLGPDATVARLQDDARRYSVVHLAAHGTVDASDPARSGLVLSASGEDDGFLSVPDVLELDLDADLVVLSACDTARGAVRRGEGVQSLARAFLYAGAREVVATLWQVDDGETEVAMRSLYRGMRDGGLSAPAALRQARLELRNAPAGEDGFVGMGRGKLLPGSPPRAQPAAASRGDLRGHPYFWAPFIVIGGSPRSR